MHVELRGIAKRFGAVEACAGADFTAGAARVSALVGENGAGKTTLMRILAGRLAPDAGEIIVEGRAVRFSSPREAAAAGVAMVEQDCRVIGALSVLENIILGAEESKGGVLSRREAEGRLAAVLERLKMPLALDAPAASLAAGDRQRMAIARALYRRARAIILDEPTSLLGPAEREVLFAVLRGLAKDGASVIFISHKLAEVFEVADTITVLRAGRRVFSSATQKTSPGEVAAAMVGGGFESAAAPRCEPGDVVMRLSGVSTEGEGRSALKRVSLDLRSCEIVGIAGVTGNGQRALCDAAAGIMSPSSGKVSYPFGRPAVGIISDDVDAMDIVAPMSVWENRILGRERDFSGWRGINARGAESDSERLAEEFDIRGAIAGPASALSGGNRQRLVLARELAGAPRLVIAEEPARGLDIRGAELARRRLREAATAGAAVLLVSYDLDELYALADRIFVISSGRLLEPSTQPPLRAELGRLMAQ